MTPIKLFAILALSGFALAVALGAGGLLVYKLVTPAPAIAVVPEVKVPAPPCPRYPEYRCADSQP